MANQFSFDFYFYCGKKTGSLLLSWLSKRQVHWKIDGPQQRHPFAEDSMLLKLGRICPNIHGVWCQKRGCYEEVSIMIQCLSLLYMHFVYAYLKGRAGIAMSSCSFHFPDITMDTSINL